MEDITQINFDFPWDSWGKWGSCVNGRMKRSRKCLEESCQGKTEEQIGCVTSCPRNWSLLLGKCYYFDKRNVKYAKAVKECSKMDAKLFEPKDLETNELVFK